MYRCKYMEISDTKLRQVTMYKESKKEAVLFSEDFKSSDNTNEEFVVGLPIELKKYEKFDYERLASEYKYHASKLLETENVSIAIHTKKEEEEMHFHINFNNNKTKTENEELVSLVQGVFSSLNDELKNNLN